MRKDKNKFPSLTREIVLILVLKVLALTAIWFAFFSGNAVQQVNEDAVSNQFFGSSPKAPRS